jgi:hypothetical protein
VRLDNAEVQLGRKDAELQVGKDFPSKTMTQNTLIKRMSRLLKGKHKIG